MNIDALRKAHEKLKRKSQRQRDRIKELEGLMRKHGHHLDLYKDELVKILGTKNAFVMIDELLTTKDRQQK